MNRMLRRSLTCLSLAAVAVVPAIATSGVAAAQPLDWLPIGGPYMPFAPEVLPPGDVVLEVGFNDASLYAHTRENGEWSEIYFNGEFSSAVVPAVTTVGPEQPYVEAFGVGIDEAVWYGNTLVEGWQPLGGLFVSSPTAVVYRGVTYVFGLGSDNAVWYRSPTSGWYTLGGHLLSDLSATTDGTNLYISGIGLDGALWSNALAPALTWSGWHSQGGDIFYYPTATFVGDTGYVFGIGVDDAVWYTTVTAGQWSAWQSLGGITFGPPAASPDAGGGLSVFVVGQDQAMYQSRMSGGAWSGWHDHGGYFISAPGAGEDTVFGIGRDDNLWVASYM